MTEMIANLFLLVTQAWTFIDTNFVPATAADMNLIHVAVWSPIAFAAVSFLFSLIARRGRR